MRLVDVYQHPDGKQVLYRLLEERDEAVNISHRRLPAWDRHVQFVDSKPYEAWYIVEVEGTPTGGVYLSKGGEIGIFLLKEFQHRGIGPQAVEMLMSLHPRKRFLANINPPPPDGP